jgi:hypothetical protein
MDVKIFISEKMYDALRKHLFKGRKEQGAFLFATDSTRSSEMILTVKEIYLIPSDAWDIQDVCYLELSQEEKVKVMMMAKTLNCHLIECHSHRNPYGVAHFSFSDLKGLDEFISYIRWKLPGKKYGALIWTESSISGMIWDMISPGPIPVKTVCIVKKDGTHKTVRFINGFKRIRLNLQTVPMKRGDK